MILGVFENANNFNRGPVEMKACYRCKVKDPGITCICLNCKRATYCNRKCMKKNRRMHDPLCNIYLEKSSVIKELSDSMRENFNKFRNLMSKSNDKKSKETGY
jgi:hypothetical protein